MSSSIARAALGLAAAGLLGALPTAHGANVTLHDWAFGQGHSVRATGYVDLAGGFRGSLSGAGAGFDTESFLTYCIEIEEGFQFGANALASYRLVDGREYFHRRRGDAGIADRLGQLMAHVAATPALVDSSAESTSLQIAVWNLVYDSDLNATARSSFRETGGAGVYANTLLAPLDAAPGAQAFRVWALEADGTQDFLLALPAGSSNPVPLPATLALAALGLVALGASRRASHA